MLGQGFCHLVTGIEHDTEKANSNDGEKYYFNSIALYYPAGKAVHVLGIYSD
jgi:hypothetical protein